MLVIVLILIRQGNLSAIENFFVFMIMFTSIVQTLLGHTVHLICFTYKVLRIFGNETIRRFSQIF